MLDIPNVSSSTDGGIFGSLMSSFGYGSNKDFIPYLVRSTSLPDSSFEDIQIPYPGHTFKMAGIRNYGDWSVSFNIDEKGKILDAFNKWHDMMYNPDTQEYSSPDKYMRNQELFLLDGTCDAIRKYKLVRAYPKAISATGLDYSSVDIATVDVTFAYQYYTTEDVSSNTNTKSLIKSSLNRLTGSAMNLPRL